MKICFQLDLVLYINRILPSISFIIIKMNSY
ncbi:uncharacterized protein METZ01_LOCUS303343 [marine metagenome]|uniref:Uncharacterized protein n=1 Tax=marine metagenome TaxID=408172 RepID=A0A382MNV3_9ZZZZ